MKKGNSTLLGLSAETLRRAADIKDNIATLTAELSGLLGENGNGNGHGIKPPTKLGAWLEAHRDWERHPSGLPPMKPKQRTMPLAAKRHLSKIARARWRRAKAIGKNSL